MNEEGMLSQEEIDALLNLQMMIQNDEEVDVANRIKIQTMVKDII